MMVTRRWCSAEKFVIKPWISLWSTSQQSWPLSAHPHTAARHFSAESYQCSANSLRVPLTHTPLLSARVDCTQITANVQLNLDFSPPQSCMNVLIINTFIYNCCVWSLSHCLKQENYTQEFTLCQRIKKKYSDTSRQISHHIWGPNFNNQLRNW